MSSPPPVIDPTGNKIDNTSQLHDPQQKDTSSISLPSNIVPFTPKFDNEVLNLHLRPDPYPFENIQLFERIINFSSIATYPFGVSITYDDHYGLPFIKEVNIHSPWYINLSAKFCSNIWLIAVESSEPITATGAYEALRHHIKKKKAQNVTVLLCKWEPTARTRLNQLRATFDQVRSNERVANKIMPSGKYAIYCPTKPSAPSYF